MPEPDEQARLEALLAEAVESEIAVDVALETADKTLSAYLDAGCDFAVFMTTANQQRAARERKEENGV